MDKATLDIIRSRIFILGIVHGLVTIRTPDVTILINEYHIETIGDTFRTVTNIKGRDLFRTLVAVDREGFLTIMLPSPTESVRVREDTILSIEFKMPLEEGFKFKYLFQRN